MQEETNIDKERRPIRVFGILLPSLPGLIFRFGGLFLRFKRDAKKAGKVFRTELLIRGLTNKLQQNLQKFIWKEATYLD